MQEKGERQASQESSTRDQKADKILTYHNTDHRIEQAELPLEKPKKEENIQ